MNIPESMVPAFQEFYGRHDRQSIQMFQECAHYDKELFYRLQTGSCNFQNREFITRYENNSLGVRDDENSLSFPEMIFTGDSFTMGWGVEQDSSFANRLEQSTGKKALNAGLSSYGTVRELRLLEQIKFDSVNMVVIQYNPNDSIENKQFLKEGNSLVISPEELYDATAKRVEKQISYFFGKHTALITKYLLKHAIKAKRSLPASDANEVAYFLNALSHISLPMDNVQIVVFELCSSNKNDNLFITRLKEDMRNAEYPDYIRNMIVLDVTNDLTDEDYFILDDHLNSKGHKKVADLILKELSARNID